MTVSPTQFVPLTTIREGTVPGLGSASLIDMGGLQLKSSSVFALAGLSLEFPVHPESLLRMLSQPFFKYFVKKL
jgi:hypothetical protein